MAGVSYTMVISASWSRAQRPARSTGECRRAEAACAVPAVAKGLLAVPLDALLEVLLEALLDALPFTGDSLSGVATGLPRLAPGTDEPRPGG